MSCQKQSVPQTLAMPDYLLSIVWAMIPKDVFYVDKPWVVVRRNRVLGGDFGY